MCKTNTLKMDCDSAKEQHRIKNPELAKTYTDDDFRTMGQAISPFHLNLMELVSITT